jgi:16S rRNA (cytidine1402-2'-O)-methyltransferase
MGGRLYIVSTPIGDPDDITVRALRILREVAFIAAEDPGTTRQFLEHHEIENHLTSYQNLNKETQTPVFLERLRQGQDIALVCDAGTPLINDPGSHLVSAVIAAGFDVRPVPGPSAFLAGLVASGLPTRRVCFMESLPSRDDPVWGRISRAAEAFDTLVAFVERPRLGPALRLLCQRLGNRPAVLALNATRPDERFLRSDLAELLRRRDRFCADVDITIVVRLAGTPGQSKSPASRRVARSVYRPSRRTRASRRRSPA